MSGGINALIVWVAQRLGISPLIAHILLMLVVFLAFLLLNPSGFDLSSMEFGGFIGVSVLVIFIGWVTKGKEGRRDWLRAEPWQDPISGRMKKK